MMVPWALVHYEKEAKVTDWGSLLSVQWQSAFIFLSNDWGQNKSVNWWRKIFCPQSSYSLFVLNVTVNRVNKSEPRFWSSIIEDFHWTSIIWHFRIQVSNWNLYFSLNYLTQKGRFSSKVTFFKTPDFQSGISPKS